MIAEEIRKDTFDKKGKKHNKLVCIVLFKEDSIVISMKNREFAEDVEVDIGKLLGIYADEEQIKDMSVIFKSIYEKANHKRNIAS